MHTLLQTVGSTPTLAIELALGSFMATHTCHLKRLILGTRRPIRRTSRRQGASVEIFSRGVPTVPTIIMFLPLVPSLPATFTYPPCQGL